MDKLIISKSKPLSGEIKVSGAKNSVLKILAATLLTDEECVIEDVPDLLDVRVMLDLLKSLGSDVRYYPEENRVVTKVVDSSITDASYELTNKMRASIVVMGPLLAKRKRANVSYPGGCAIGARPIDLHLKGFRALGVDVHLGHGFVEAKVNGNMKGNTVYLDFPSVGATENIMLAATLADGVTVIENAAQEPEISDLAMFLIKMGAKISGAGTSNIRITGVKKLRGVTHQVIPDRIEAGTYIIAVAMTKGRAKIDNVVPKHLSPLLSKLEEAGVKFKKDGNGIIVDAREGFTGVDVTTLPYPGFPTDLQSQFMVFLCLCKGSNTIKETIFENRFMFVSELARMGAKIKTDSSTAEVYEIPELEGAIVRATDLRAGAALVLAGLVASGETQVLDVYHIDRGFVDIEEKLNKLGANIKRIKG